MKLPKICKYIPKDEPKQKGLIIRGLCDHDENVIFINPKQGDREMLITVVHEMLHYVFPKHSEAEVERNSIKIGTILWRFGYRNSKRKKTK